MTLDFETYSEAGYVWADDRWTGPPGAPGSTKGLPVVGARSYVMHPTFEIIWLAYGGHRWRPGLPPPVHLLQHVQHGGLLHAWNVGFERWVWELYCVPRLGWPAVQPEQWRCTMARARAYALPGALGKAGAVLGLDVQKDAGGASLMKRLSMPVRPTKADPRRRVLPIYDEAGAIAAANVAFLHRVADGADTPRRIASAWAHAQASATQDAIDTEAYGRYCATDVQAEIAVGNVVPQLSPAELDWWQAHETINRRGIHVDRAGVEACIAIVEQVLEACNGELVEITGIDSATKVQQLTGWLRGRGWHLDSLDEDTVAATLTSRLLPPDVRRVLEIRAAAGSASVKKLFALRNRMGPDDRVVDLLLYHAARTGRSTGEGPQPLNMPAAGPDTYQCGDCGQHYGTQPDACPHCRAAPPLAPVEWSPRVVVDAMATLRTRSLPWVERVFGAGSALAIVAGCLRSLFCAAPGHDLISTDYSSIEAVGAAMLSGEAWRKDVFNTHGKVYEASAAAMFGLPLEEILGHRKTSGQHHPLRKKGKIAELAFGYQGWIGSALAFDMPGTEDEIKQDILRWRAASPALVWLWGGQEQRRAAHVVRDALRPSYAGTVADWARSLADTDRWDPAQYLYGIEGMAVMAILCPGEWRPVVRLDGTDSGIAFRYDGTVLSCRLPSGRLLTYHRPLLEASDRGGYAVSYEGWNTNPKSGPVGWVRMRTWGGKLFENVNQAACRDILAPAVVALERAGYPVVLHVYDEIVAEVPEGWGSIEEFEEIVTRRPPWAHDWPIRAPDGYRAKTYRKG